MFAQIIRGTVSDGEAVAETFARWSTDLAPGATGWLGTTAGVTDDGELFIMVRFESAEAARANSERPEQDRFWAEASRNIIGNATFQESSTVLTDIRGDVDSAGFVQIMTGQTRDPERTKQLMTDSRAARTALRPDVLGQVAVDHGDGEFTMAVYCTTEEAAREGERKGFPEQLRPVMQELWSLNARPPEYLDLRNPWLDSPR